MKQRILAFLLTIPVLVAVSCQKQDSSEVHDTAVIQTKLPEQSAVGGADQITIFATCPWSLQGEDWFTIEPASGEKGISESTITIAANTTGVARTGIVRITAGSYSGTYEISQKAE